MLEWLLAATAKQPQRETAVNSDWRIASQIFRPAFKCYNCLMTAGVAEEADAPDLKSGGLESPCGFKSRPRHFPFALKRRFKALSN